MTGASAKPTALVGPEGLEPHSRLHASHDIASAEPCVFCPDWTAWERDLKAAATKGAEPISDEHLYRFRQALADVHCKSSSAERHEVEYRLQRFGAKMWRRILARLDAAEARQQVQP